MSSTTSFDLAANPERMPLQATPSLPLEGLSEDERRLIQELDETALKQRRNIELCEAYYLGLQVIQNLRIAIPKELEFLRTIVGWPRMAVDPYVERLHLEGFRRAGQTDVDETLGEILTLNGFGGEQALAFTDALSMGRGYWMVGSPAEPGDVPVVSVESPLNMSVLWDLSGKNARAAKQEYWDAGRRHAALVLPGKTITLAMGDADTWEVENRDEHGFDFVPVVRMPNRSRTHDRDGRSEITPALRSYVDSACRTLLGLEVARELYSVPQKAILGAAESDFKNADGTSKKVWDTYIHRVLALNADPDGDGTPPQIKQMAPYDPSVFTKLLDWYASAAAGEVAATPQDMGLYTQGNPASAEAVQAYESRRDRRAVNMQQQFSPDLVKVAQYVMRFTNGGALPKEYRRLDGDWAPVTEPILSAAADGVSKLVDKGVIPATSDVTLKRLGFSAVDRQRLEQDRDEAQGAATQSRLADLLEQAPAPPTPTSVPTPAQVFGGRRPTAV